MKKNIFVAILAALFTFTVFGTPSASAGAIGKKEPLPQKVSFSFSGEGKVVDVPYNFDEHADRDFRQSFEHDGKLYWLVFKSPIQRGSDVRLFKTPDDSSGSLLYEGKMWVCGKSKARKWIRWSMESDTVKGMKPDEIKDMNTGAYGACKIKE
ncbi:hypothetical protein HYW58_00200 [Candidatus Kaiserbacteria bacterium]|nr:hypothetical protein [Candidatus Kaiserbacteria bacterium]